MPCCRECLKLLAHYSPDGFCDRCRTTVLVRDSKAVRKAGKEMRERAALIYGQKQMIRKSAESGWNIYSYGQKGASWLPWGATQTWKAAMFVADLAFRKGRMG